MGKEVCLPRSKENDESGKDQMSLLNVCVCVCCVSWSLKCRIKTITGCVLPQKICHKSSGYQTWWQSRYAIVSLGVDFL